MAPAICGYHFRTSRILYHRPGSRDFATNHQQGWDRLLPLAEFGYNSAYHNTLKTSPFKADYGYSSRVQLDFAIAALAGPW